MSRVSKNIVFNLSGQLLTVALGFVGTRLVFRQLGSDALGILYFALALSVVLTPILDMGVSTTVMREVARHFSSDPNYVSRLIRTSTLFYWSSYALLAIAVWLAAPSLVSHWLNLGSLDISVAVPALRTLALALLLTLPRSLYSNLVRAVERMELNNVIDVATSALQQFGSIVVLVRGGGLVQVAYCFFVAQLLGVIAYVVVAKQFFSWKSFLPGFSLEVIRENSSFALHLAAYSLFAMVQMESDKVLVSKLLPVALLGFYGVAQTTVTRVMRIPAAVNQAAFPTFSVLSHKDDRRGLMREYRRLQDLVCYGLVPIFAAIIFSARPLFTYLLNAQAAQLLLTPTALMCLGWYMNGTLNVPSALSMAMGRPDISSKQNFYALFFVLPITAELIWRWHLVGAGLSLVVYHLFAYAYGARRVASECLQIRPLEWYGQVLKILALAAATYGTAWVILALVRNTSIFSLATAFWFASIVYLYFAYAAVGEELRQGLIVWRGRVTGNVLRYMGSN